MCHRWEHPAHAIPCTPTTHPPLQILAMVRNPHYLYRMTVLSAISSLASFVPTDVLCNQMLPVLTACAKVGLLEACE